MATSAFQVILLKDTQNFALLIDLEILHVRTCSVINLKKVNFCLFIYLRRKQYGRLYCQEWVEEHTYCKLYHKVFIIFYWHKGIFHYLHSQ